MMYQLSNVELIVCLPPLPPLTSIHLINPQGAIFLAVIVGGFTWPMLADISTTTMAILQAFWFSSLIIAVAAVAVAVHQSVFLARLVSVPNHQAILVEILCYENSNGERVPRRDQTFIWLLAVALLEWSMCFWLGGYAVFIWDITRMRRKDQSSLNIMVCPDGSYRWFAKLTRIIDSYDIRYSTFTLYPHVSIQRHDALDQTIEIEGSP